MRYRWRSTDARGRDVPSAEVSFAEQTEAEAWLSENWQALLAEGVDAVTLLRDEAEVYGPMSLHAPG